MATLSLRQFNAQPSRLARLAMQRTRVSADVQVERAWVMSRKWVCRGGGGMEMETGGGASRCGEREDQRCDNRDGV